eukprot:gene8925-biopygen13716
MASLTGGVSAVPRRVPSQAGGERAAGRRNRWMGGWVARCAGGGGRDFGVFRCGSGAQIRASRRASVPTRPQSCQTWGPDSTVGARSGRANGADGSGGWSNFQRLSGERCRKPWRPVSGNVGHKWEQETWRVRSSRRDLDPTRRALRARKRYGWYSLVFQRLSREPLSAFRSDGSEIRRHFPVLPTFISNPEKAGVTCPAYCVGPTCVGRRSWRAEGRDELKGIRLKQYRGIKEGRHYGCATMPCGKGGGARATAHMSYVEGCKAKRRPRRPRPRTFCPVRGGGGRRESSRPTCAASWQMTRTTGSRASECHPSVLPSFLLSLLCAVHLYDLVPAGVGRRREHLARRTPPTVIHPNTTSRGNTGAPLGMGRLQRMEDVCYASWAHGRAEHEQAWPDLWGTAQAITYQPTIYQPPAGRPRGNGAGYNQAACHRRAPSQGLPLRPGRQKALLCTEGICQRRDYCLTDTPFCLGADGHPNWVFTGGGRNGHARVRSASVSLNPIVVPRPVRVRCRFSQATWVPGDVPCSLEITAFSTGTTNSVKKMQYFVRQAVLKPAKNSNYINGINDKLLRNTGDRCCSLRQIPDLPICSLNQDKNQHRAPIFGILDMFIPRASVGRRGFKESAQVYTLPATLFVWIGTGVVKGFFCAEGSA